MAASVPREAGPAAASAPARTAPRASASTILNRSPFDPVGYPYLRTWSPTCAACAAGGREESDPSTATNCIGARWCRATSTLVNLRARNRLGAGRLLPCSRRAGVGTRVQVDRGSGAPDVRRATNCTGAAGRGTTCRGSRSPRRCRPRVPWRPCRSTSRDTWQGVQGVQDDQGDQAYPPSHGPPALPGPLPARRRSTA